MNPEAEINQNSEPVFTFTQRLGSLLLSKTPLDKNNGMIDVHRDGLFKAFMKKLDWAEKKSAELKDPKFLKAAHDYMLSDSRESSFEELESKYETDNPEIPGFIYKPVKEEETSIPIDPVILN